MSVHSSSDSHLVRLIRSAPRVDVPAGLTEKVMDRIPETSGHILQTKCRLIGRFPAGDNGPGRSDEREGPFFCIVTGFFYLVLGIVLLADLENLCRESEFGACLRFLPWISFLTALWFTALGLILATGGYRATATTKWGILILISALPGGAVFYACEAGTAALCVFAAVSSMALASGVLLYRRLGRYMRTVEPALRRSDAAASPGRMGRGR